MTERFESAVHVFEFGSKGKWGSQYEEPVVEKIALFLKEYLWDVQCQGGNRIRDIHFLGQLDDELRVTISQGLLYVAVNAILRVNVGVDFLLSEVHLYYTLNHYKTLFNYLFYTVTE